MATVEAIMFWLAITAYAAAAILAALEIAQRGGRFSTAVVAAASGGLVPHTAAFAVRWISTGRPPFISLYELVLAGAWTIVVAFLVAQRGRPAIRVIGVAVMPVVLLSMGLAMTLSPEANPLTTTLRSWWLAVHIAFALVAYGAFAISFGASALLLVAETRDGGPSGKGRSPPLPDPAQLDALSRGALLFGFVCDTVMIVSGMIWANNAWGRFWGWDPVETWSLITWLVYGLSVHLRFVGKWRRRHAAWLAVGAFVVVVFSFWGVPHFWRSIHDYSLLAR